MRPPFSAGVFLVASGFDSGRYAISVSMDAGHPRFFQIFQFLTVFVVALRNHLRFRCAGASMHAVPVLYKDHTLKPLAVGSPGSYAAMVIVTTPAGAQWASGILGYFETEQKACQFAIRYGEWEADGRKRAAPKTDGRFTS
ncbi:hypothetical protein [Caballeronia sp. DA-9]|uniref:hypothetical protein n=1 Tax=Caballeronia sp. DA-9 TaxID=3436237 RepID=UPI003F66E15E